MQAIRCTAYSVHSTRINAKSCATTRSTATARSAQRGNVTGQGCRAETDSSASLRATHHFQPPGHSACSRVVCCDFLAFQLSGDPDPCLGSSHARQWVLSHRVKCPDGQGASQALNARAGIGPLLALREAEPQSIPTGTRLSQPPPPFRLSQSPVPVPVPSMDGVM